MMSAPSSAPPTAPRLSNARWMPNARARIEAGDKSTISASRGALRMPLPTRSSARITNTCHQSVAKPSSGRIKLEIRYPLTASGLR